MKKIRVSFAGVGSNTSSTLQTIAMALQTPKNVLMNGIMYRDLCGYKLEDIEVSCAFDVDINKVGIDISKAISTKPNACQNYINVPNQKVHVSAGPLFDGIDGSLESKIQVHDDSLKNDISSVIEILKNTNTDVLVANLPTGAKEAVKAYAIAAAKAGVAFVNATAEEVARDDSILKEFEEAKVPLLGDDLRSHLGATTLHMALIELMKSRGIDVKNTYQLNFGGNMDFYNLASPGRSASKQVSKKNSLYAAGIDAENVSAGPNGYVEYLNDTKICYLHIEGSSVLDSNITMEVRLEVQDSPNASGVIVNAIRLAMVAKDRKLYGSIDQISPYLFKSPRVGMNEPDGLKSFRNFIEN